jgi:hypothetical protein
VVIDEKIVYGIAQGRRKELRAKRIIGKFLKPFERGNLLSVFVKSFNLLIYTT